jgi:hypothetical protein
MKKGAQKEGDVPHRRCRNIAAPCYERDYARDLGDVL